MTQQNLEIKTAIKLVEHLYNTNLTSTDNLVTEELLVKQAKAIITGNLPEVEKTTLIIINRESR